MQIEQDASVVLGLLRPIYYDEEFNDKNLLEMHILKNRDGISGKKINYDFYGGTMTIKER